MKKKKQQKRSRAEQFDAVARKVMQATYDSFIKKIHEEANKGASQVEFTSFGYSEGQVHTLRKMFQADGFEFMQKLSGGFTVRW